MEPRALFDDAARTYDEIRAAASPHARAQGRVKGYVPPSGLDLAAHRALTFFGLDPAGAGASIDVSSQVPPPMLGRIERLVSALHDDLKAGRAPSLALRDSGEVRRLAEVLGDEGLPVVAGKAPSRPGAVRLTAAPLSAGFILDDPPLSVYAHSDIFPATRRAPARWRAPRGRGWPRSPSSSPATTWSIGRTASPGTRASCIGSSTRWRATTCSWSTRPTTSSTCPSTSWTGSAATSARTPPRRSSRGCRRPTGAAPRPGPARRSRSWRSTWPSCTRSAAP